MEGKINQMYSRNQFKLCKESFITTEEVPENIISLRGVARHNSNLGGQGYNIDVVVRRSVKQKNANVKQQVNCVTLSATVATRAQINKYNYFLILLN